MRKNYPLWLYVGVIFTVLIIVISLALGFSAYHMVQETTRTATVQLAEQISAITELSLKEMQRSAYLIVETQLAQQKTFDEYKHSWPVIASELKSLPFINSIFIGYENGDFFVVAALNSESERDALNAPPKTFFAVQFVENRLGGKTSVESFYDEDLLFLSKKERPEDLFDPRSRHWYINAMKKSGYFVSDPYFFYETFELGVTVSRKSTDLKSVIGVDISLSSLSQMLDTLSPTPGTRIVIAEPDGSLVAHTKHLPRFNNTFPLTLTKDKTPTLFHALEKYNKGSRGLFNGSIDGKEWVFYVNKIGVFGDNDENILLMAMPADEVMHDSEELLHRTVLISFCILLFSLPFIWYATQHIVTPLQALILQTQKIKEFNFDDEGLREHVNSHVTEVHLLSHTISILKDNIKRFLKINSAISKERDLNKLLNRILVELSKVANADGGIISLLDERGEYRSDARFYYKKLYGNKKNKKFLKKISIDQ